MLLNFVSIQSRGQEAKWNFSVFLQLARWQEIVFDGGQNLQVNPLNPNKLLANDRTSSPERNIVLPRNIVSVRDLPFRNQWKAVVTENLISFRRNPKYRIYFALSKEARW